MQTILITILIFHVICLLIGPLIVRVIVRSARSDIESVSEDSDPYSQRSDPLHLGVCILIWILITSAGIGYYAFALEIAKDDTPARAISSRIIPWVYVLYGVVILPAWMLSIGSAAKRVMTWLILSSIITSLIVGWLIWYSILSQVVWSPGA